MTDTTNKPTDGAAPLPAAGEPEFTLPLWPDPAEQEKRGPSKARQSYIDENGNHQLRAKEPGA